MAWSPQMQKWMKDAPIHGKPVRLFQGYGRRRAVAPVPDEALLTQTLAQILTQDQMNVLFTEGFINTEGTDPIETEDGSEFII